MQTKSYNEILKTIDQFDFVIIDKKILDLYEDIETSLENKVVLTVDNPEYAKSFEEYEKGVNFFLEGKISRQSKILAIGGGALSDFAGFIAATILRGVEWEVIPTTLLAMIDASIGGKVGINTNAGKNLIGAFHKPIEIHLCPKFLDSLPISELNSGKGELLKYAFINKDVFELIMAEQSFEDIILCCIKTKNDIIEKDFNELGLRKNLNLGHTFGHAIEKEQAVPHGIAVYFGLKLILELYAPKLLDDFDKLAGNLHLNMVSIKKIKFEPFFSFLSLDKKRTLTGDIEFIIPSSVEKIDIIPKALMQIKSDIINDNIYQRYFE